MEAWSDQWHHFGQRVVLIILRTVTTPSTCNTCLRMPRRRPLRQFKCEECDRLWWERAGPRNSPCSECHGCEQLKSAIPRGHEEGVGACKFICDCGNEYTVLCRRKDTAPCYKCNRKDVESCEFHPPRRLNRKTSNTHNCSRCNGRGNCPNLNSFRNRRRTQ